jgi:hypothetical protein
VLPLVLAIAAGASSWNLFGAPFALVTATVALGLALRRREPPGPARTRLLVAAAVAVSALAVSILILVSGFRQAGSAVAVPGIPGTAEAEARRALDDAERDTASRRDVARRELERQAAPPPAESGAHR